jgi:phosphatidylglycerol:prolipoprotein diacylglycerol transferase
LNFTPIPDLSIAGVQLPTHGLLFLLAALVCLTLLKTQLSAQEHRRLLNSIPWVTLGSLIGARVFYLISVAETDVFAWPRFWEGGMVSYGGLTGCLLVLWLRHGPTETPDFFDRLAGPCLVAWGVGRVGCLLSWYGEPGTLAHVPWGFVVGGVNRHPVTGYLALSYIVGGLLLMRMSGRRAPVALIYYGVIRGVCDQWRDYEPDYLGTLSQAVCAVIVLLGVIQFRRAGSIPPTSVESQ